MKSASKLKVRSLRVTDREWTAWESAAGHCKMTVSEFIRRKVNHAAEEIEDRHFIRELNNQLGQSIQRLAEKGK